MTSTDAALAALASLLAEARANFTCSFGAKLNIDIPAHAIVHRFNPGDADAWFMLDSVRTPPPLTPTGASRIANLSGNLETSLFGGWQKPVTLQYARVLADSSFPNLCVGGGFTNAEDILEAIMLGASTVQVATQIMVKGFDWIRRTNDRLEELLAGQNLESLQGHALRLRNAEGQEAAQPVIAAIQPEVCTNCGVCTRLVFCSFIHENPGGKPTIDRDCYGCGFCEALCPVSGAILMEPAI